MRALAISLVAVLTLPAAAQDQLTPDEFLDLAHDRTLSFANIRSGNLVGVEQFLRRDLSVWAD